MDSHIFLLFMVVVLPLTAIYVTRGKALIVEKEPYTYKKTAVLSILMALLIGVYDGFYGPGTGTFLLLLLTGVAHLPLKEANGVTKVINSTTNIAALCVFLLNGKVLFPLGPISRPLRHGGKLPGRPVLCKGGAKNVKPVIMTVLTIFFLKVLYELL